MTAPTIYVHNKGKVDEFGWGLSLIKNGSARVIDIGSMVTSIDVYESLNNMSMSMVVEVVDAANALVNYGIQPGDQLHLLMFNTQKDSHRIDVTLSILTLHNSNRINNSKARTYTISAVDKSALANKKATVIKSYNDKTSSIIKSICTDLLGINAANLNIEQTTETLKYVSTMHTPYDCIKSVSPHAVSSKNGAGQQFYFYQTADGFYFKSLKGIITDAQAANNTWNYVLSIDQNQTGDQTDFYRIIDYVHHGISNQSNRMAGVFENELVQFNHMNRSVKSKTFNYKDQYQDVQLLGKKPVVDLNHNYKDWVTESNNNIMGVRSFVAVKGDPSAYGVVNSFADNFHKSVAQHGLFRQISYHLHLNGNAQMRAGHLIQVKTNEISGVTQPRPDALTTGLYLIVNLHHTMHVGEVFQTFVDVCSDGPNKDIYTETGSNIA